MDDAPLIGRNEIAALSKVPGDALAFWIKHGLLQSETSEPRKHHRYREREARIAAVLSELRRHGMNIGALKAVAAELRECCEAGDRSPSKVWDELSRSDQVEYERALVGSDLAQAWGLLCFYQEEGQFRVRSGVLDVSFPAASAVVVDLARVLGHFPRQTVTSATDGSPADAGFEGAA